jgi:serine/threonine protein kinase
VWLAEDARLSRKVALKVLDGALVGASRERRERFRREAELVARLEHPGICGVLEADLDAELPWIAMRHVEGETLAAALEREQRELEQALARNEPHPLSGARLAERLSFFERTARALHAAHEAGVVHRDVKPGN